MMLRPLRPLLSRFAGCSATPRPSSRKHTRSCRPRLEVLEDRSVPATFTVTNTSDSGMGSLRQAILDANSVAGTNTIAFDISPSTDLTIAVTSLLPPITHATIVDGTTQPGYDGAPVVVVNGSQFNGGNNGYGLDLTGRDIVVRGLVINGFTGAQVRIDGSGGDVVVGNYLGTDVTGTTAVPGDPRVPNWGVGILSSAGNRIGGTTEADRNLISGNDYGVVIGGAGGNVVQGNFIGTDVTGTGALGNRRDGVSVFSASNTIGGTEAGAGNVIAANGGEGITIFGSDASGNAVQGNVISANGLAGILLSSCPSNVVQGNFIGTDASGSEALGNGADGIAILSGRNNTIGGTAAGAGNVISANNGDGIFISGSDARGNVVQGNFIGTDAGGTQALGNGRSGVTINLGANNAIGGTAAGAGNVISANRVDGISIFPGASGNVVQGNFIGTDAGGTQALGNGYNGVGIISSNNGASNNVVGGIQPGARNTIAFNGNDGVLVDGRLAIANAILHNAIFANARLGIELLNGGNNNQAAPTLTSATSGSGVTTFQGTFTGRPSSTYTLEFFDNDPPPASAQGQRFLVSLTVTTDANGMATFTVSLGVEVPEGDLLTATATDANANTSAFSPPVVVTG